MTAGAKFASCHFLVANIGQQQCLDRVDLAFIPAIQLILDHIEQLSM